MKEFRSLSSLVACSFPLALAACGGLTLDESPTPAGSDHGNATTNVPPSTLPIPTFVADSETCFSGVTPSAESALEPRDRYDSLSLVEVRFVDECSGLGGTWLLGRGLEEARPRVFLGDHGCSLWDSNQPPRGRYAIARHSQTAAWFRGPEDACVTFDGAPNFGTDQFTRAMVVFETQADALLYAAQKGLELDR